MMTEHPTTEHPTTEHLSLRRADGVAEVTLTRPERRNALTRATGRAFLAAVESALDDADTRVLLIRGEGPSFCAGLDLNDITGPAEIAEWMPVWTEAHVRLAEARIPIVVAAQGAIINAGGALALSADVQLLGDDAFLQIGEVMQGLTAPIGIAWLSIRHSPAVARRLCLTGDRVPAPALTALGVAAAVHPAAELAERALEYAHRLAGHPAAGVRRTVEAIGAAYPVDVRARFADVMRAGDMAAPADFTPDRVR